LYGASWISDWATIGWLSFRSAFAFAIIAVTSAALTIVRDAAGEDAGCWALAAMDNADKATPVINTRMVLPLYLRFLF